MKRSIIKILVFSILSAMVCSCDKYLDPGFEDYLTKDQVFSSAQYSLEYRNTIYNNLPTGAYDEAFMTDEAMNTNPSSNYAVMNNGSWDSRSSVENGVWGNCYTGIRRVHTFLANVDSAIFVPVSVLRLSPQLNDSLRKLYKAEARFLRAFYYFELLKRYGDPRPEVNLGIPLVPEKVLTVYDNLDFARNTYDECVNYIIKDCDSAAHVLPVKSTEYGRANKAAALALKSRLLLYAASPLANPSNDIEKWKKAAEAAKAVLDIPDYSLMIKADVQASGWFSLYSIAGGSNKEVIFSSPVNKSNSFEIANFPPSYNGQGQTNPTQDMVDAFETLLGYPITDIRSGYIETDPYYRRDPRLKYFIVVDGIAIYKVNVQSYIGGKDGINSSALATKTGYYIEKFADVNNTDIIHTTTGNQSHFWVHFRYGEILLNYAEAMAEAYGIDVKPAGYTLSAYDALKKIRDRAGISTQSAYLKSMTVEQFIDRVRNERRVELCFEGHRFWDVRRWKLYDDNGYSINGMRITKTADTTIYEKFKVEDRIFNSKMYVMPIPYSEVQKSKLLKQNTGW